MDTSTLAGLLSQPGFWGALASALVAMLLSLPKGVLQQVLTVAVDALTGLAQGRVPAREFAKVQQLAQDAARAAFQYGEGQGMSNRDRKDYALAALTSYVQAHGIKRFDATALDALLESAWNGLKPLLARDGLLPSALSAATTTTATTITAPANSAPAGLSQPAISSDSSIASGGAEHAPAPAAPLAVSPAPAGSPADAISPATTAPLASPDPASSADAPAPAPADTMNDNPTAALLTGAA